MINKIFNWIFSSFFRTLGRILVYIFIALIIFIIMNGKVHAAEWATGGATITDIFYTRTDANVGNSSSYYFTGKTEKYCLSNTCSYNSTTPFYLNYVKFSFGFDDWWGNDLLWSISINVDIDHPSFNANKNIGCSVINGNGTCTVTRYESTKFRINFDGVVTSHYFGIVLSTPNSPDLDYTYNFQNGGVDYEFFTMLGTSFTSSYISGTFLYDNSPTTSDIINEENQTQQKIDETNSKLDETNSFLTDDTAPESDISALGNVQGLLPPGPVDSLLNIPFKFLSIITSSMSGTCVPLSGTFVFDSTLTLPCFSEMIYNDVPEYLMFFINLIPAGFILIKYLKHLYKKVDRAVSMNTTADDEWGVL